MPIRSRTQVVVLLGGQHSHLVLFDLRWPLIRLERGVLIDEIVHVGICSLQNRVSIDHEPMFARYVTYCCLTAVPDVV